MGKNKLTLSREAVLGFNDCIFTPGASVPPTGFRNAPFVRYSTDAVLLNKSF
jgi:hypothetical protein